ncbi:MAG TPA: hypothetical protein VK007_06725, partial [Acidimicrobiales bacterium]|nr:hypothetical protein [Acidimicrobiales bacterium]
VLAPLVAASIPWAVTSVYLTEARVRHFSGATIAITVTLTVSILGSALWLVPRHGIDGAAWAFLGGNLVAAGVALVSHLVGRRAYEPVLPAGPEPMGGEEPDADEVMGMAPLA